MARTRYLITKSSFLGGWAVVSPGLNCEGETVDSLAEAVAWMDTHAWTAFEAFYETHTAETPAHEKGQK